ILGQVKAEKMGYTQVLWLDGNERKYVEEVGTMNIMFKIDGEIWTAPIEGTVLPGVTRDSMIHLLKDWGYTVREERLAIDDLMKAGHDGKLEEVFGTGTAAVISPVGELRFKDDVVVINGGKTGELTQKLYDTLTGIQWGRLEDKYGWTQVID
ncbi:MAG: aminotransferase class IV, partial [Pseudobutyrivibrio sp.]|nr:aminotransferase class IV [Pseudobutyrivibrio sp.]